MYPPSFCVWILVPPFQQETFTLVSHHPEKVSLDEQLHSHISPPKLAIVLQLHLLSPSENQEFQPTPKANQPWILYSLARYEHR